MTADVKPLGVVSVPDERRRQTIQLLEQFLADAKAGKWDEVLIVAGHADDEVFTWAWTRSEDLVGLIGRLERLKYHALRRMDPER
jgi:hypothetical protein